MKRYRNYGIIFAVICALVIGFIPLTAFAGETVDVNQFEIIPEQNVIDNLQNRAIQGVLESGSLSGSGGTSQGDVQANDISDIDGSSFIPDTSIDDANQWVNNKGEDLIGLGVTVARPLSIMVFMLGLVITLVGAIAKSSYITKGVIVIVFSIMMYVGCIYAPELVHFFSTWLSS